MKNIKNQTFVKYISVNTQKKLIDINSVEDEKDLTSNSCKEDNIQNKEFHEGIASGYQGERPMLDLLIKEIEESNPVISVTEQIQDNEEAALIPSKIASMMNELQRDVNSKFINEKLNSTAKKGFFTGGILPFGYSSVICSKTNTTKKTLILNPIEAAIVKELFNLATNGIDGKKLSLGGIARALNQQNLMRRGTQWDYRKVSVILKNPIYHGERLWGKNRTLRYRNQQLITIKSPSIISKEQFLSAQKNYALVN
jgi:hypothetical protein